MNMLPKNICVIGLGYVGLTLSVILAKYGFGVYGVERNPEILNILKKGKAHFFEKGLGVLLRRHFNKDFFVYNSIPKDKKIDVFIITVGTPVKGKTKKTITDDIIKATEEIRDNLKNEQLVILRSTVAPGTTREVVLPILKKSGKKFYLSFCPERTIEGVALRELEVLPQVIGGLNEESNKKTRQIFKKITKSIIEAPSIEYAEMNKIVCNTYRDLTFAFANEIAILSKKFGLDANKLIKTANLGYLRANIPQPGFVGGACLSKDSHILANAAKDRAGFIPELIKKARELNSSLPAMVASRIEEALKSKKRLSSPKIFLSGFAFKGRPATDDLRDAPSLDLLRELRKKNLTNIYGHDFMVNDERIKELGVKVSNIENGFRGADVVLIMNNHIFYDKLPIEKLILSMRKNGLFFDAWQNFELERIKNLNHAFYENLGADGGG